MFPGEQLPGYGYNRHSVRDELTQTELADELAARTRFDYSTSREFVSGWLMISWLGRRRWISQTVTLGRHGISVFLDQLQCREDLEKAIAYEDS